jgi:hypothetical protein
VDVSVTRIPRLGTNTWAPRPTTLTSRVGTYLQLHELVVTLSDGGRKSM